MLANEPRAYVARVDGLGSAWAPYRVRGMADATLRPLAPHTFRPTNESARGHIGRNLWDRRYAVVDEERGIVLTILRFGRLHGPIENASSVTAFDRLVAEFFTVKSGKIQEVQALLFNRDDAEPTGWDTHWYGPGPGGWQNMPTGQ